MWLYNFAGRGALVPEVAWLPLSYYIPELPPTIIQLYIIEEGNFKRQESNYIESLYTVSDDDSDDRKRLSAHWDATLFNSFRNGSSRGSSRDSRGSVGSRPTSRSGSLIVGEGGPNHFLGEGSNHFSL
jgi:hypothetical protein